MVYLYLCDACERGDHEHCEKGHPAPKGRFGGSQCKCFCQTKEAATDTKHDLQAIARETANICEMTRSYVTMRNAILAALERATEELRKERRDILKRLDLAMHEEKGLRERLARAVQGADTERLARYERCLEKIGFYFAGTEHQRIADLTLAVLGGDSTDTFFARKEQP